jgi:hypothetical protein
MYSCNVEFENVIVFKTLFTVGTTERLYLVMVSCNLFFENVLAFKTILTNLTADGP